MQDEVDQHNELILNTCPGKWASAFFSQDKSQTVTAAEASSSSKLRTLPSPCQMLPSMAQFLAQMNL
jgi:hypothetical protein